MIVLDASVVLEILLGPEADEGVLRRVFDPAETRHAPHLLDVEVSQVIRRYWLAGEIDDVRGREMLGDLGDLPIARYSHTRLLPRMWQLRANISAYDAVYVALAEALDAPLLTLDRHLASARGHNASIELISPAES